MSAIGITRSEKTLSGALALAMHALFALLLVVGVTWQQRRSEAPVVVDLWSSLPPQAQPKVEPPPPRVKPEPEPPKPAPKVEPKPKPAPKPEPKPVVKPDIALKEKLEKERKLKEQQEVKRREDERKKQEALKREKLEKERLRKEQEVALQKMLAERDAAQAAASARAKVMAEYVHSVRERIKRYVVLPPSMPGNPEAQFDVVQIPGGEVLTVTLRRSSGVAAYDEAVERAIRRAQPLPPPPAGVAFSEVRELNLKFRPKE